MVPYAAWWTAVLGLTWLAVRGLAATDKFTVNLLLSDAPAYPGPTATIAGTPFVINFLLNDYQTNATLATSLGFCVPVRTPGPAQCSYTLTFATGTVEISGLSYIPPVRPANPLSDGVLSVTGGTGKYLGASGYYQEFAGQDYSGSGKIANGVLLEINY